MKTLLVVDYIKGIAESPGTCAKYLSDRPEVLTNTNLLIASFRERGWPIYFVRLAFDSQYTGLPAYAPNRETLMTNQLFQLSSDSVLFIDRLDFRDGDTVLNKKSGDPFCGSGLLDALHRVSAQEVVFAGIATDNAIEHGANTAMQNNFKVTVVGDACGASSEVNHLEALARIGRQSGFVFTTDDFLCQRD